MAIARIVHQHVDRPGAPLGVRHGRRNRVQMRHVQQQRMRASGRQRRKGFGILGVPHGPDDGVAGVQRALGKGPAQAGTDAGNQESLGDQRRHGLLHDLNINYIMI